MRVRVPPDLVPVERGTLKRSRVVWLLNVEWKLDTLQETMAFIPQPQSVTHLWWTVMNNTMIGPEGKHKPKEADVLHEGVGSGHFLL